MERDGLTALWIIFGAQLIAGLLILFVLYYIDPGVGRIDFPLAFVVVGAGVVGIGAAHWTTRRPLDTATDTSLALSYRTSFFIGFALAEAPLMISFVLCFITKDLWPYVIELPLWLIGMSLIAPTNRNLGRRQQEVQAQGSSLSLVESLRKG